MSDPGNQDYLVTFIATLKQTVAERERLQEQVQLWQGRVRLATERGADDLAAGARARVLELTGRLEKLLEEERALRREVERVKEEAARDRHRFERRTDTEQLLAELEMLTGEEDKIARGFADIETQQELDRLKEKLRHDNDS